MVETLEGLSSVNIPMHKDPVYPQNQIEHMLTNAITQAGERSWFFKKALTFIVMKAICQSNQSWDEQAKYLKSALGQYREMVLLWLGFSADT